MKTRKDVIKDVAKELSMSQQSIIKIMNVIEKTINGFEHIFGSRKNRAVIGIIGMTLSSGLLLSAYVKLPDDEGESDDEN